jgi:putative membrane protein
MTPPPLPSSDGPSAPRDGDDPSSRPPGDDLPTGPPAPGPPAPGDSAERDRGGRDPGAGGETAGGETAGGETTGGEAEPHTTLGAVREPQRLHALTLLLRMLASLPALAFILLPVVTNPNSENFFSLITAVIFGVFAIPAIVLRYLRFSYRITPKQIVIQKGVFNRKNRSIPIERVQNVQIEQNLAARFFGIAKVKIETAGSSATEGTLEYVGIDVAKDIRQVVRSYKRRQAEGAAGAGGEAGGEPAGGAARAGGADAPGDDALASETLFTMSLGRVLLSGAFRFSLLYIALIFSLLQFFQPETIMDWITASMGDLEGTTTYVLSHPALAALATVVAAALLGWVSGILLHLNRYYGFALWLEEDKLRKRHGLLTVTEGTIPLSKVQALILRTNPLMRAFGWYELEVQTIGVDLENQGHRVIVPFAQLDPLLELAGRVRSFDLPASFERVSPLTIRRSFLRYTVALSAVALTGVYFWPAAWWHPGGAALPWWAFAAVPLILVGAVLSYRYHGYRVRPDAFYIRRGVFAHRIWILPTEKFHVFYTSASIFQRRLGLKTLFVDTAGASGAAYPEVIDLPADEADRQLHGLHDRFRSLYRDRVEAATGSADTRLSADQRPQLPDDPEPVSQS